MLALKRFFTFRQGRVAARRYAREQQRLRNGLERGLEKKLTSALNKRVRMVSEDIKNGIDSELGATTGPLRQELEAVFTAHMKRVFTTVYEYNNRRYKDLDEKADATFGLGFGNSAEFDSLIRQYMESRRSYIANMSQSHGRAIINDVLRLREEGFNLPQISSQLRNKYNNVNKNRAAMIARTETHSATGAAQDAYHRKVSDSYGIVMKKQWVATSDGRTRANHSLMNGTIVEMDETFLMPDGTRMKHVGDPAGGAANVINCRCVILYVDTDDEVEDDTVLEDPKDIPVNESGMKVDSKGRPIGMTAEEFEKSTDGLDFTALGKQGFGDMKKRLKDAVDGTWASAGWEKFSKEVRFRGTTVKEFGGISSALRPTGSTTLSYDRGVAMLASIHPELDQLADTFGIPRTRTFKANRGRSIANMGDASMGWNKKWIESFGAGGAKEVSSWKRGDPLSQRPFNAISYMDNAYDQMRTVAYHEFGHQVHQLYGLNKGLGTYYDPFVEGKIRGRNITGGPSRYSQSNPREWFAENFAMWAMRREDLVDPEFIELIEELLEGAKGG